MKLYNKSRRFTVNSFLRHIFLICFLFCSFQIKAQNQSINLANRITLREAFVEIEKQTDLSVDYNDQLINTGTRIKKGYKNA